MGPLYQITRGKVPDASFQASVKSMSTKETMSAALM